jgi:hypothetical protein
MVPGRQWVWHDQWCLTSSPLTGGGVPPRSSQMRSHHPRIEGNPRGSDWERLAARTTRRVSDASGSPSSRAVKREVERIEAMPAGAAEAYRLGIGAGAPALEDAELWRVEEAAGGADRGAGSVEGLGGLIRGDCVVASWVGVLGLVAAAAQPVE